MSVDAVIKVGGSLLDWPELPARLSYYLKERAAERLVIVAGGGAAADVVRGLDRVHGLGEERAHDLALRALDFTAHVLASAVTGLDAVDDEAELSRVWGLARTPVFAPRRLLESDEKRSGRALPHTWDVTTDSIAAYVAQRLGAPELVLLKSAPLPRAGSAESAARAGLVDAHFPAVAQHVERVFLLNLRAPSAEPLRLVRSLDDR
ncbi:MAG: uridylate kinase [Isosphaeraceae bacterium]|nr:uridylate kinase [Isosphaeraceae bacterium]